MFSVRGFSCLFAVVSLLSFRLVDSVVDEAETLVNDGDVDVVTIGSRLNLLRIDGDESLVGIPNACVKKSKRRDFQNLGGYLG